MNRTFRTFTIQYKKRESELITSFYLAPTDPQPVWPAEAGQYLTLRLPMNHGEVLRPYSISSDISDRCGYRVSVKRERAPSGVIDVPDGLGSCWLHDHACVGDSIDVAEPRGTFVLDKSSVRPVVLLSAGVGLTPLVSMLHSLKSCSNDVWFIHVCADGNAHAFKDEVESLREASGGRIHTHFVYRKPSQHDRVNGAFDSQYVIDRNLIQGLLPLDDYDLYLCGPRAFIEEMRQLFTELGLPAQRIAYESFGETGEKDQSQEDVESKIPANATATESIEVVFAHSDQKTYWQSPCNSLLELAEESGLTPEFSCREGICGSCTCELIEGCVEYFEEPIDTVPDGQILLCCTKPKGNVVLAL